MVCVAVSNIVHQVTVLPSFTGNLHCCKSGRSAPFLQQWDHSQLTLLTACSNFISIYPNLFEFLLNLFEFYGIFQESMWKKLLGQFWVSSHHPMFGLTYILDREQQLQWGQMMVHLPGYPTDIDRQPNREERSREKQSSSMMWQSRQRSECAYVSTAHILNYSNTWYNNYLI